jgi:hypothetical protein
LALEQYKEGAIDFERIFNLQNVLVRQEIDLAESEATISLSLIEIYRALRGGWQIRIDGGLGQTVVTETTLVEPAPAVPAAPADQSTSVPVESEAYLSDPAFSALSVAESVPGYQSVGTEPSGLPAVQAVDGVKL